MGNSGSRGEKRKRSGGAGVGHNAVFVVRPREGNGTVKWKALPEKRQPALVSMGERHTCVVTEEGQLFSMGDNSECQLGIGEDERPSSPTTFSRVFITCDNPIRMVLCRKAHTFLLTDAGEVFSFGTHRHGAMGLGKRTQQAMPAKLMTLRTDHIRYLSAGDDHTAAINSYGNLFTWGLGDEGQLGHGEVKRGASPNQVYPKKVESPYLRYKKVIHVGCGHRHTVIVTDTREVAAFGLGEDGQLGYGGTQAHDSPRYVEELAGKGVIAAYCADNKSAVVTERGEVWVWGSGLSKPDQIQVPVEIEYLSMCRARNLMVSRNGQIFQWDDEEACAWIMNGVLSSFMLLAVL
eukprot:TRINITY_DN2987_c1_g2_i1.p1 TRINITY_DN2987_c1_g2~~TRINITY_DN2987_c1_g2_i1.p1  ORF type:complete len:349 (+),score=59.82 TRINITY_DN2987_c1_g2_i1:259-1305(+)